MEAWEYARCLEEANEFCAQERAEMRMEAFRKEAEADAIRSRMLQEYLLLRIKAEEWDNCSDCPLRGFCSLSPEGNPNDYFLRVYKNLSCPEILTKYVKELGTA